MLEAALQMIAAPMTLLQRTILLGMPMEIKLQLRIVLIPDRSISILFFQHNLKGTL